MFRISARAFTILLVFASLFSCKTTKPTAAKKPEAKTEQSQPAVIDTLNVSEEQPENAEPEPEISKEENFNAPPVDVYEFRAGWVATVANINWPSKPGENPELQKKQALTILDSLKNANFNAVIFQVRPQADALYKSELEPWSYYLTGKSGKAPQPFYDPLTFWIEAAHERGMELHVWLNPYRAHHTTAGEVGAESVIKKHPDWVVELKNGMWWMDPANKNVQDHAAAVVRDIVKRYDIDGVHFDDYFYPYASYNGKKDFPDEKSWKEYLAGGGELSRSDWRRKNVDDFILRISEEIKEEKPFVKFGISPFGIWRPEFPPGIKGMDQYEELYADAKLWLNKGWVDYFTPQLYWPTKQVGQSFPILLSWWASENVTGKHVWPGINLTLEDKEENKGEIASQIMISRAILPDDPGTVHWNVNPLMKNRDLANSLEKGPYRNNALVPKSPWLDDTPPAKPDLKIDASFDQIQLNWKASGEEAVFRWVLYYQYDDAAWEFRIFNEGDNSFQLEKILNNKHLNKIGLTAVDRVGNQSDFETVTMIRD